MTNKLKTVMLVDDNPHDNYFHEIAIKEYDSEIQVLKFTNPEKALAYLDEHKSDISLLPDLVFLDINMPAMNGWEFLAEYDQISLLHKEPIVVVMLTTSEDPDDVRKAKTYKSVSGFKTKPLTNEVMVEIVKAHFPH